MKKNTFIIIVIAVVLAATAYFVTRDKELQTAREELRDFAFEDTSSITKIFLASKTGTHSTLTKGENGWIVNGKHNARPDAVKNLLVTIQKLQIFSPVASAGEPNIIKNLASHATKVEIYANNDHKKPAKVYYVGGPTQNQLGTYMMMENSSKPFIMYIPGFNGYLSPRYFTSESEWRSREMIRFDRDDIASLEFKNFLLPEQSYTILNKSDAGEAHEFQLLNHNGENIESIDTLKIATYLTFFEDVQFEGYDNSIKDAVKDSIIENGPNFILTITDKKGVAKTLTMFNMPITKRSSVQVDREGNPLTIDRDRFYGMIDNEGKFVVLQYFVFEKIIRLQDEFVKQKKLNTRPAV
ncbi:MAG: hypothetical protein ACR2GN_02615 [Bacteroidia bacterium]